MRANTVAVKQILIVTLFFLATATWAEEKVWDQEAARERVQAVLNLEKEGRPWNDIPWLTSVRSAEKAARDFNKPLFVFVFIKKPVGPKDAQC